MIENNRNFWKWLFFSLLTCGIYELYFIYKLAKDVNTMCDGDGKKTSGLIKYILFTVLACGIYSWYWDSLGRLLVGLGPLIAMYRIIDDVNTLAYGYNHAIDAKS